MHGVLPRDLPAVTDHLVSGDDRLASESWFAELVHTIHPKDAGLFLHCLTGFEERTCYRYASGARKPPAYFLRALLRSEQGATFLRAVMDKCEAAWWRDHQRAERIAEQVRKLDLE